MKSTKHLLLIIIALISLNVNAQEAVSLTINVETAGTLPDLIPTSQKNEITNMTLTGYLNGTDIRYIREMAGVDANGTYTEGKLSSLDLSNAKIVAGGEHYYISIDKCYSYLDAIGVYTFRGCNKLTSVTIPNSVTTIGNNAFGDCTALTSIIIPNSVISIGDAAFDRCSGLISITISNGVTSIGNKAFSECTSLNEFIVSGNNSAFKSIEGVLFNKDGTKLIAFPNSKSKNYTIPNSVNTIGNSAFYRCPGLTSVTIPNSVTTIEDWAFSYCDGLTSVTFPNSVTKIGVAAFYFSSGLTSVNIPNGVTSIEITAFRGCTSLKEYIVLEDHPFYKSIEGILFNKDGTKLIAFPFSKSKNYTIPNSVNTIGYEAFFGCGSLTSVTIPNSVTSIENNAFFNCYGLTSVTFPNSVISIGNSAFSGCKGITYVTIPNSVTTIGNLDFSGCTGLTSINIPNSITTIRSSTFLDCTGLTSVTFPNSLTTIDNGAFLGCKGLTSVTFPNGVTTIENNAFLGCSGLTSVTIPSSMLAIVERAFYLCDKIKQIYCEGTTPPKINSDTFLNIFNSCELYVPKGAYSSYCSDPYWCRFTNIKEQIATSITNREICDTNVYSKNGSIIVKGGKLGDSVDIYSISGSLLHKIKITDDIVRISVAPQSLYIVKTGDRSFKIAL